jgi:hypothetical protein
MATLGKRGHYCKLHAGQTSVQYKTLSFNHKEQLDRSHWVDDKESPACLICAEKFGVLRRRHHCRKCGILCCQPCSSNKLVLVDESMLKVRVCDPCFVAHTGDVLEQEAKSVALLHEQVDSLLASRAKSTGLHSRAVSSTFLDDLPALEAASSSPLATVAASPTPNLDGDAANSAGGDEGADRYQTDSRNGLDMKFPIDDPQSVASSSSSFSPSSATTSRQHTRTDTATNAKHRNSQWAQSLMIGDLDISGSDDDELEDDDTVSIYSFQGESEGGVNSLNGEPTDTKTRISNSFLTQFTVEELKQQSAAAKKSKRSGLFRKNMQTNDSILGVFTSELSAHHKAVEKGERAEYLRKYARDKKTIRVEKKSEKQRIANIKLLQNDLASREQASNSKGEHVFVIYERQRWYPFKGWSNKLLPTDPPRCSDHAKIKTTREQVDTQAIGEGWVWRSDWKLDYSNANEDGFMYGSTFKTMKPNVKKKYVCRTARYIRLATLLDTQLAANQQRVRVTREELKKVTRELRDTRECVQRLRLDRYFPYATYGRYKVRECVQPGMYLGCEDVILDMLKSHFAFRLESRGAGTGMSLHLTNVNAMLKLSGIRLRGRAMAKLVAGFAPRRLVVRVTGSVVIPCVFNAEDSMWELDRENWRMDLKIEGKTKKDGKDYVPTKLVHAILHKKVPQELGKALESLPVEFHDLLTTGNNFATVEGFFNVRGHIDSQIWTAPLTGDSPASEAARARMINGGHDVPLELIYAMDTLVRAGKGMFGKTRDFPLGFLTLQCLTRYVQSYRYDAPAWENIRSTWSDGIAAVLHNADVHGPDPFNSIQMKDANVRPGLDRAIERLLALEDRPLDMSTELTSMSMRVGVDPLITKITDMLVQKQQDSAVTGAKKVRGARTSSVGLYPVEYGEQRATEKKRGLGRDAANMEDLVHQKRQQQASRERLSLYVASRGKKKQSFTEAEMQADMTPEEKKVAQAIGEIQTASNQIKYFLMNVQQCVFDATTSLSGGSTEVRSEDAELELGVSGLRLSFVIPQAEGLITPAWKALMESVLYLDDDVFFNSFYNAHGQYVIKFLVPEHYLDTEERVPYYVVSHGYTVNLLHLPHDAQPENKNLVYVPCNELLVDRWMLRGPLIPLFRLYRSFRMFQLDVPERKGLGPPPSVSVRTVTQPDEDGSAVLLKKIVVPYITDREKRFIFGLGVKFVAQNLEDVRLSKAPLDSSWKEPAPASGPASDGIFVITLSNQLQSRKKQPFVSLAVTATIKEIVNDSLRIVRELE